MTLSHEAPRFAAVPAIAVLLVLANAAPAARADVVPITESATVTITSTMSYTATSSKVVTATASWGNPAITKTATDTLTATDTESATRSATVTQTAIGDSPEAATAAAKAAAQYWATSQSQIAAITVASISASVAAATSLAAQEGPKQMALYNGAQTQAQAAVVARDGRPKGASDACGTAQFKSDETRWSCSFDDEFSGKKLDTSKWTAWNGINYWADPNTCYYSDPSHVSVSGGSLNLSVTRLPSTSICQELNGPIKPTYGAGLLETKDKFSQTYGQFEARIKFAGGYGIHNDFWLFPDDTSSGDHAEVDIAEPSGSNADTMISAVHRSQPGGSTDLGSPSWCPMTNWAAQYHTYKLLWTPTQLQFSYDGYVCAIVPNTGEFTRNFFATLQVLADGGSVAPTADTPLPATMSVDWVRVWK